MCVYSGFLLLFLLPSVRWFCFARDSSHLSKPTQSLALCCLSSLFNVRKSRDREKKTTTIKKLQKNTLWKLCRVNVLRVYSQLYHNAHKPINLHDFVRFGFHPLLIRIVHFQRQILTLYLKWKSSFRIPSNSFSFALVLSGLSLSLSPSLNLSPSSSQYLTLVLHYLILSFDETTELGKTQSIESNGLSVDHFSSILFEMHSKLKAHQLE